MTTLSNVIIVGDINIENKFSLGFFEASLVTIFTATVVDSTKSEIYFPGHNQGNHLEYQSLGLLLKVRLRVALSQG